MIEQRNCLICGNPIPTARLRILPKTNSCAACVMELREAKRISIAHLHQSSKSFIVEAQKKTLSKANVKGKRSSNNIIKNENQLAFDFDTDRGNGKIAIRLNHEPQHRISENNPLPKKVFRDRQIGLSFGACPVCGQDTTLKESTRDFSTYITCVDYPKCKWRA